MEDRYSTTDLATDILELAVLSLVFGSPEEIPLEESKMVGTKRSDDKFRDIFATTFRGLDPEMVSKQRKSQYWAAKRAFDTKSEAFLKQLWDLIDKFEDGKLSKTAFKARAGLLLRGYYAQAYSLGLKSSGIVKAADILVGPEGSQAFKMTPKDRQWVDSASRHELTFLNKFIDDIADGRGRMPYKQRAEMYKVALWNIFLSGRLQGEPRNILIYWIPRKDGNVCPSCRFLQRQSPFTKDNIPTFPTSGATRCLTHCRCRISFKEVEAERYVKEKKRGMAKSTLVRRLNSIKKA